MNKLSKMMERRKKILEGIEAIEGKRKRSEFGMVNSIIRDVRLDSDDVKYFNYYTSQIGTYKEELRELDRLIAELKESQKQKS